MIYIRKAEYEDARILAKIKVHALKQELQRYYGRTYSLESLYNAIEDEHSLMRQFSVYKVMLNNEIIGRFMLDNYESGKMRVEDFVIGPEYQSYGYGLRVLQMMEASHPYIKSWILSALARSTDNQSLYQKAGYVEIERDDVEVKYEKVIGRKKSVLRLVR